MPEVCDGSDDLRLFVTSVPPFDRVFPGDQLLFENGSYVQLDGHCHYWAKSADDAWLEVRSGTLDVPTAGQLLHDIHYARWTELEGDYPPAGGDFDFPDLVFYDDTRRIVCIGGCRAAGVPNAVTELTDVFIRWNLRLSESGAAVEGDVRIRVLESALIDAGFILSNASTWPVTSVDLHAAAVTPEDAQSIGPGEGILLTGADANSMRTLRREYMAGDHGTWWYEFIPIVDEAGALFEVYVRDTTPFENERGLIDWLYTR